ncbi:hypothetical protein VNO77_25601 [Canavalia gladiata]|uniref:C2H2-type domain-containing protein n=1 Tax=Canavalia gladiata TaxID=3824 RepID=A0AAN9LBU3_CANGL
MNFSSASDKENAKKKEKDYNCSCCERVFGNYQAAGEHQRAHHAEMMQHINQNDAFLSHNPVDVTKPNPDHGNAPMNTFFGGPSYNPYEMKGIYYDNNAKDDNSSLFMSPNYSSTRSNNVSFAPFVQTKPSAQSVEHPFYMGSSGNFMAPGASSVANHQFDGSSSQPFVDGFPKPFKSNFQKTEHDDSIHQNPVFVTNPSFPNYHMTGIGSSSSPNFFSEINTNKFPTSNKPNVADTQTHSVGSYNNYNYNYNIDQISESVKKHNRDEFHGNFGMMNPPKRANAISTPPVCYDKEMLRQQKEIFLSAKDAKTEAGGSSHSKNEVAGVSTSENANYVEENDEADLDLSLHL